MAEMRAGSPTRCLTMLIASQSGWELRNRCAFTATWFGQENGVDVHQKGQVGDRREVAVSVLCSMQVLVELLESP